MEKVETVKLTQYSHGAGCGCKIAPGVLEEILKTDQPGFEDIKLWVGNQSRDDAAVYALDEENAVISTTDFFMPIVDDPFDFGRIASVNAISDVYAMGGTPLVAIAILGWPINELPASVANQVLEGSRAVCREAGIALAGGHSIDSPEPIFGLAVTGRVLKKHLKRNNTAKAGARLFLTKALGVGILSTAQKKDILQAKDQFVARDSMVKLNSIGAEFGRLPYIQAMTDVTGFGLLGHLAEMCEGSNTNAIIDFDKVPVFPEALEYMAQGSMPGGTGRNWKSYGHKVEPISDLQKNILCDPQTSGGLLVAVDEGQVPAFQSFCESKDLQLSSIGQLVDRNSEGAYIKIS